MRVNWFLPFLRRQRPDRPAPRSWLSDQQGFSRWLVRFLPSSWVADHASGRAGRIRRTLRRIGPTFLASPLRRLVQASCLATFLLLFFYICWPYGAVPAAPGEQSSGWSLAQVADDGTVVWQKARGDHPVPLWVREPASPVHLVDSSADSDADGYLGLLVVERWQHPQLTTRPARPLSESQIDRLLFARGPWAIHETSPVAWPSHYADRMERRQWLSPEFFLTLDPLVSLSTAIASRNWIWSLACTAIILSICVVIPRGFCGYVCPLGTIIDLVDWSVGSRIRRFRVSRDGWWVHLKYFILSATLFSAVLGVLVTGYVAAIPVLTRGMLFIGDPLQMTLVRGVRQVPTLHVGHLISVLLFLGILSLGLLSPRFWCKYLCPSGAVFSAFTFFRVTERTVASSCVKCRRCVESCPFDAIKPDLSTRTANCTFCQTCGGVCPVHAIDFVTRGVSHTPVATKTANQKPVLLRRGFLSAATGTLAASLGDLAAVGLKHAGGTNEANAATIRRPVRPPGSVPEEDFLTMCTRCGQCMKVCPNHVLQPAGFEHGIDGLWTPRADADWAGCEPSCNACGRVCPTGAIRALSIDEKRSTRIGLAVVDEDSCLPATGHQPCQLCSDECISAGYNAIEFIQKHTQVDDLGQPIEGTGFLAPVVLAERCMGCGLCQSRCYAINVKQHGVLGKSAIIVQAGPDKEDRFLSSRIVKPQRRKTGAAEGSVTPSREEPSVPIVLEKEESGVATSSGGFDPEDPFGFGSERD